MISALRDLAGVVSAEARSRAAASGVEALERCSLKEGYPPKGPVRDTGRHRAALSTVGSAESIFALVFLLYAVHEGWIATSGRDFTLEEEHDAIF